MSTRTVYVVGFGPAEGSPHGVGGYDWYYSKVDAVKQMQGHLEEDGYVLTFFEAKIPVRLTQESVCEYINEKYNEWLP